MYDSTTPTASSPPRPTRTATPPPTPTTPTASSSRWSAQAGGVTTNTYDADGNLTSTTDPLGHTTGYAYDAQNRLVSETDPLGNITTYTYSSFAATKDLCKTMLSDLIASIHRKEQHDERVCRQARGEDPRRPGMLRPRDHPRSSSHGRCGVLLDLALLKADRPESAAASARVVELQGGGAVVRRAVESARPDDGVPGRPSLPAPGIARLDGGVGPRIGGARRYQGWPGMRLWHDGNVLHLPGAVRRERPQAETGPARLLGALLLLDGSRLRLDAREDPDLVPVHDTSVRQRARVPGAEAGGRRNWLPESRQCLRLAG